jgi:hypothetical protein
MLSPTLTTWNDQYERMVRAYARLSEPYESSIMYDDDLIHYFQDCWHLKDWIKNDPALSIANAIELEVNAHQALRIVADLANGSKHYVRNSHREGANVTSKSVTVHLGSMAYHPPQFQPHQVEPPNNVLHFVRRGN